ncbi:MAG: zinc ribbon domain-containing protein [Desulfobacterales bacterium]|nr:zinc ribbon domain-containing protein [Desulfobacterales bacterium]
MPIYEYRCEDCGKISEFLIIKTGEAFLPQCKRCKSKKMSRILSRVRVVRSEESRIESLADPSKWGDLDEKDPKSMARMMKRMGKELGEDVGDVDQMMEEAMDEEISSESKDED